MKHFSDGEKINPRLSANIFSNIFYWWLIPLFKYGRNHNLEENDLYKTMPNYASSFLGDKLEILWKRELMNKNFNLQHVSLFRIIRKEFGKCFLKLTIYAAVLHLVVRIIQPLALGLLLGHFNSSASTKYKGLIYAAIFTLISFIQILFGNIFFSEARRLATRIRVSVSSLIYRKVVKLTNSSVNAASQSMIINLLSNDISKLDDINFYIHFLWIVPIQLLMIGYISYTKIGLAGIFGIIMTTLQSIPVQFFCGSMKTRLRSRVAVQTDKRILLMNKIIHGVKVIKMYTWEKSFEYFVSKVRRRELDSIKFASYLQSANYAFAAFTKQTSLFFTIIASLLLGEPISAELIFTMAFYFNILHVTLGTYFVKGVNIAAEAPVTIRRIEKFLLLEEIKQKDLNVKHDECKGLSVCMNKVNASWEEKSKFELQNLEVSILSKKLYALVGEVGGGKSLLLNLILGEIQPTSGEIFLNGTISYASQVPWLFHGSIQKNILFGEPYDKLKYETVLNACCLTNDLTYLPNGDKTSVGERGAALSGGQCARVNLARAVYKNADVYIFDDPLSSVDTQVGKHIFEECIQELLKDKTRIIVTSQIQYLQSVDATIVLKKGTLEMIDKVSNLMESEYLKNIDIVKQNDPAIVDMTIKSLKEKTLTNNFIFKSELQNDSKETEKLIAKSNIGKSIFIKYFKFGSSPVSFTILVAFYVIAQLFICGSDYWIMYWTKYKENYAAHNSSLDITSNVTTQNQWNNTSNNSIIYVYVGCIVGTVVFSVARNLIMSKICIDASKNIHSKMIASILKAPMHFFETNSSGIILNRFTKDSGITDETLPMLIVEIAQTLFLTLGSILLIIFINWWMIFHVIIYMYSFLKLRDLYLTTVQALKRIEGAAKSPVFSHVISTFTGLATIRSCKAEPIVINQFDEKQDDHTSALYLFIESLNAYFLWLDFLSNFFIACISFTFVLLEDKFMFISDVGLAISQAYLSCIMLLFAMGQIAETMASMTNVERMIQFTEIEQEETDKDYVPVKPAPSWPNNGLIEFKNVFLRYFNQDEPVLKNLNFSIESGMKVGIVGRTGAGKSSLISAFLRMAIIDGKILIDNVDTRKISLNDLRSKVSVIPQEPVIFPVSVRENLDPTLKSKDDTLWSVLEQVQLKSIFTSLDHIIVDNDLSTGQQQLLCFARALIRKNKIMILDEASANIDNTTDDLISTIIREKFNGCTVLIIAHRLHSIIDCDKVMLIHHGEILEYDHPHVLLQQRDSYFSKMVDENGSEISSSMKEFAKTVSLNLKNSWFV